MSTIRLLVPTVNAEPSERPDGCRYCGHWRLHRHGTVGKPVRDHRMDVVRVDRYKCAGCGRTFRHYPHGITAQDQSQRTVVLAALLYGFGLSCSAAASVLSGIGSEVSRMSVWRDAQAIGARVRRRRPCGPVRVLGADETVFRVRGHTVLVGFVVDGETGQTLGFDVLTNGETNALLAWLRPYAEHLGVTVLVTDGHAAYGRVAAELELAHQLCLTHVRKAVANQVRALRQLARAEWGEGPQVQQFEHDLACLREVVQTLPCDGLDRLWQVHHRYLEASTPGRGGSASATYRLRMLSLSLLEHWDKLCLAQKRADLSLDGTNNVTERAISKSKIRYKTMRGYKSQDGMSNGIALTQWLYRGERELDLTELVAA